MTHVCAACGCEMRPVRNATTVVVCRRGSPVCAYYADRWGCPECGAPGFYQLALEPFWVRWQDPDPEATLRRLQEERAVFVEQRERRLTNDKTMI